MNTTKPPQKPPRDRCCTAKSKSTGKRCKNWPVKGYSVCRVHGAHGGPPEGNKNALKTGEYESILVDSLEADEQYLFCNMQTDPAALVDEEIRLITIRERRILGRIAKLQKLITAQAGAAHSENVVALSSFKSKKNGKAQERPNPADPFFDMVTIGKEEATGLFGGNKTTKEPLFLTLHRLDEALTRVQRAKAALIKLKHQIETGSPEDDGTLDELARVIKESADRLAGA